MRKITVLEHITVHLRDLADWVSASAADRVSCPIWPKSIYRKYIKRAADRMVGHRSRKCYHIEKQTNSLLTVQGQVTALQPGFWGDLGRLAF